MCKIFLQNQNYYYNSKKKSKKQPKRNDLGGGKELIFLFIEKLKKCRKGESFGGVLSSEEREFFKETERNQEFHPKKQNVDKFCVENLLDF